MAQDVPPVPPAPDSVPAIPTPPAAGAAPEVVAASAPTEPFPAVPSKRKIWPFVLGGGVLLLILIVVGISLAVGALLSSTNGAGSPAATVIAFDDSFKRTDCALFQSTTTTDFQNGYFTDGFTCDEWEPIATGLHDNGVYHYTVVVNSTKISGDTADVTTSEKDTTPNDETSYELDYHLVKGANGWLIDGITNIGK
jgi:hypothetical protein